MESLLTLILIFSILFQLTAAAYSVYLIRYTGFKYSWMLLSIALLLMSVRRAIPLYYIYYASDYHFHFTSEVIGLILSILILFGIIGIGRILLERKLAEEKINSLLKEKEIILKEVHHRIKNNMNTTYGLIVLQADAVKDPEAKKALDDASNRVQAMITLYEELFISGNYSEVSMKNYLPMLAERIIANFPNREIVTLNVSSEDFVIDEKKLSGLGLIINELLTNIMKYAFVGRNSGSIIVDLKKENKNVFLIVSDNGVGFSKDDISINHSSFGLSLVDSLTKQLNGKLTYKNHSGTTVTLEFNAD